MKKFEMYVAEQQAAVTAARLKNWGAKALTAEMCAEYEQCLEISATSLQHAAAMLLADEYSANILDWDLQFMREARCGDIVRDVQTGKCYMFAFFNKQQHLGAQLVEIEHDITQLAIAA